MSFALPVNFLDLLEDVRKDFDIKMIRHQHKQEPVSKTEDILEHSLGLVRDDWSIVIDEEHSDARAEQSDNPEDEMKARDGEEHEQPEPKEDVNLIIDHVDRKDTQSIKPGEEQVNVHEIRIFD